VCAVSQKDGSGEADGRSLGGGVAGEFQTLVSRYPCSARVCVSKIGKLGKMKIIEVKISDLSRDPANARKHDERNLAATIASFRRFGQQHPIVIDRNNVVRAGNCRLDAAEALGWDTIKAVRSDLSGSDAIAYAIADNRTSELAGWDEDILAAQLQGLLTDDEALLEAAGFTEGELEKLLDDELDDEPGDNTEEIDPDGFEMDCTCPKCGFEFDLPK